MTVQDIAPRRGERPASGKDHPLPCPAAACGHTFQPRDLEPLAAADPERVADAPMLTCPVCATPLLVLANAGLAALTSADWEEVVEVGAVASVQLEGRRIRRVVLPKAPDGGDAAQVVIKLLRCEIGELLGVEAAISALAIEDCRIGRVACANAVIDHRAFARNVAIEREADFSGVYVNGPLDWWGVDVGEDLSFSSAHLGMPTRDASLATAPTSDGAQPSSQMRMCKFRGDAMFAGATFRGEANFSYTIVDGEADFGGVEFAQNLECFGTHFRGAANFRESTIAEWADLTTATFSGPAAFDGATFGRQTQRVRRATDGGGTEVWQEGGCEFARCEFAAGATFNEVHIYGDAVIHNARVVGALTFAQARIFGRLDIRELRAHEAAVDLSDAELLGTLHAQGAAIGRGLTMRRLRTCGSVDLRHARVGQQAAAAADDASPADGDDGAPRSGSCDWDEMMVGAQPTSTVAANVEWRIGRGNLQLDGFVCAGEVRARKLHIEGLLQATGAAFAALDLGDAHATAAIAITRASVQRDARLTNVSAQTITLRDVTIGRSLRLDNARVSGTLIIDRAEIERTLSLVGAEIAMVLTVQHVATMELDAATLNARGPVRVESCQIREAASFRKAQFHGPISLRNAEFRGRNSFDGAQAVGPGVTLFDLSGAVFTEKLDLTEFDLANVPLVALEGLRADNLTLRQSQVKDRLRSVRDKRWAQASHEFALLVQAFDRASDFGAKDWALYSRLTFEGRRRRQELADKARMSAMPLPLHKRLVALTRAYLMDPFLRWGIGYGTKPQRVGLLMIGLWLIFSFLYWSIPGGFVVDGVGENGHINLLHAMYFSASAELVVGLENLHPQLHNGWVCFLAFLQAFLGVGLVTLFVSTVTRKVIQ